MMAGISLGKLEQNSGGSELLGGWSKEDKTVWERRMEGGGELLLKRRV